MPDPFGIADEETSFRGGVQETHAVGINDDRRVAFLREIFGAFFDLRERRFDNPRLRLRGERFVIERNVLENAKGVDESRVDDRVTLRRFIPRERTRKG